MCFAYRPLTLAGVMVVVLAAVVLPVSPAQAASFAVTNTNDSGAGSLRQAIDYANAGVGADAITFDAGVTGTITLTSGQLTVLDDLTIDGPGAADLTIRGYYRRVMEVSVGATLDLSDVTIADGYVCSPPVAAAGAGILNAGTLTVTNTTFSGNVAAWSSCVAGPGGAIANSGGSVSATNSTFSGNSAQHGGAISNAGGGVLTVTNSTLSANRAFEWGGAIFNSGGSVTVTGSTVSGNSQDYIGSVSNYSGTLIVRSSTLSGNTTRYGGGGGIHNYGASTVTNSTLSGNSGGIYGGGGGIHNSGALTLRNSIVASNPAGGNCYGAITDGAGNLSWPDATCPGINVDPLLDLAGLQNNGGATQTIALEAGSPAIDAAVDATCPATDQRGVIRPQGPACDIGAFEVIATVPPSAPLNLQAVPGPLGTIGRIDLTWESPASNGGGSISGYTLCRARMSGAPSRLCVNLGPDTAYSDTDASPLTTYYYVMSASNVAGEGPSSSEVCAKPSPWLADLGC